MRYLACFVFLAVTVTINAQSYSGSITDSDDTYQGERKYDAYPLDLREHQMVTVRMTADDFDTLLILRSPRGEELINDDFGGPRISQLDVVAPVEGEWTVIAATYDMSGRGAYDLTIEKGSIGNVETTQGRLDPSDTVAIKGEYFDTHKIKVEDEVDFHIELVSFGFDGYLAAFAPSGESWRNDDSENTNRSRVGPLSGKGTWTIYVTSVGAEAVGAYDINFITFP